MVRGYIRVSSRTQARDGNSLEAQEIALREEGAEIIYSDAYTGTKTDRPALNKLLKDIKAGDKLIVTKLDRIARSASQGADLVNQLLDQGITVHILNMGLMDNSPTGKLIRNIMFAFAEFERDMIVERTSEGRSIAKANNPNYREGRPPKYNDERIRYAVDMLKDHSYSEVARLTGISVSTLTRAKRKLKSA